jgi:hypothetical protein
MTPKTWAKFLRRDGGGCVHCGETERLSPQHRAGRGMGGSKLLDRVSNIIVLCSDLNSRIESDAEIADYARVNGWKISRQDDPEFMPVWYATEGRWYYLDDFFGREVQLPEK